MLATGTPMLFRPVGSKRQHTNEARKGGRFDAAAIGRRLEIARGLAGLSQKDMGSAIWPAQDPESARQAWSKMCAGRLRDFNLAEIEIAVDLLAATLGSHPAHPELQGTKLPGFPFIDLRESRRLETGRG